MKRISLRRFYKHLQQNISKLIPQSYQETASFTNNNLLQCYQHQYRRTLLSRHLLHRNCATLYRRISSLKFKLNKIQEACLPDLDDERTHEEAVILSLKCSSSFRLSTITHISWMTAQSTVLITVKTSTGYVPHGCAPL